LVRNERRKFLAGGLFGGRLHGSPRRPLNVIFVPADDLGWADTIVRASAAGPALAAGRRLNHASPLSPRPQPATL
jgi:hypothetical protein